MRLTLRTLLAWLDDTLPPADVKQIGKQVGESPVAQELVDRTYRVTRQRRLLVPPSTGPDAIDANAVASYLDGELSAEDVADYEKRCLTSDVNLAEVASVHQILSLIGQKAKVPPEAKHRMYRLIKGRESGSARAPARPRPPAVAEPVTPPIPAWSAPASAKPPLAERLGIAALVVGLLVAVGWTGLSTFLQDEPKPIDRGLVQTEKAAPPEPTKPEPVAPVVVATPTKAKEDAAKAVPKAEATEAKSAGLKFTGSGGLAMRWDAEKSDWVRIADNGTVKDEARLLVLTPFWASFSDGPTQTQLIGSTDAKLSSTDPKAALRIGLDQGRAILKGAPDGKPYVLTVGSKLVSVASNPGTVVGLQKSWPTRGDDGKSTTTPLLIFVPEGEATVSVDDAKEVVSGPGSIAVLPTGALLASKVAPPSWLAEDGPSPAEKQLGDRYLKRFSPSGSVLRDLVQAIDGDDPDVRRMAIFGLGDVGDPEMIVPVMNNTMVDPGTRRAAADVLSALLACGGDREKAVKTELTQVFGQEYSDVVEKLLIGFSTEAARREATYVELVKLLSAPELGTRELAIRALMALSGRDSLEYDPTRPDGRGLKAWQDLLHRKELAPAGPARAGGF